MKKFRVVLYDRQVRHFEKVFSAPDEEDARTQAEEESIDDEGWEERYENLFSEQYIESIEEVEEGEEDE